MKDWRLWAAAILCGLVIGCEPAPTITTVGSERRVHHHTTIHGMPCVMADRGVSCDWSKYDPDHPHSEASRHVHD